MIRGESEYSANSSRLSRAVVLVATLGVATIAACVLVPIVVQTYVSRSSARVAPARSRAIVHKRSAPVIATPVTLPAEPAETAPAARPDADAAVPLEDPPPMATAAVAPPAPAVAPAPNVEIAAATPWPSEPPPPAPAVSAEALPQGMPVISALVEPAPAEETVPLPRPRPSRAIGARLAIPLPRPRPEFASEGPTPEQAAFERDVERMR